MVFRVRLDEKAQAEIDDFVTFLRDYSEAFAFEQIERLEQVLETHLGESPHTWNYFALTGAPYRGYLFRVGRTLQYWIIYTINDDTRTVRVLRFWQAVRDPDALEI